MLYCLLSRLEKSRRSRRPLKIEPGDVNPTLRRDVKLHSGREFTYEWLDSAIGGCLCLDLYVRCVILILVFDTVQRCIRCACLVLDMARVAGNGGGTDQASVRHRKPYTGRHSHLPLQHVRPGRSSAGRPYYLIYKLF